MFLFSTDTAEPEGLSAQSQFQVSWHEDEMGVAEERTGYKIKASTALPVLWYIKTVNSPLRVLPRSSSCDVNQWK